MTFKYLIGHSLFPFVRILPDSYSKPFGPICKKMRNGVGRLILSSCGKNVNIEKGANFSKQVRLGNNSGLGIRSLVSGDISIGNDVMMGPDVKIYTSMHCFDRLDIPMGQQGVQYAPVRIGDDVWIGANVIILPGVTVGSHSVLGAGAVVTKDVPDFAIVGGVPARIIRYRKELES